MTMGEAGGAVEACEVSGEAGATALVSPLASPRRHIKARVGLAWGAQNRPGLGWGGADPASGTAGAGLGGRPLGRWARVRWDSGTPLLPRAQPPQPHEGARVGA